MDLRPTLSREFAEAVYESLADIDVLNLEREGVVQRWTDIIRARFTSRSIPTRDVSSDDPNLIAAFLDKYPQVRPVLDHAKEAALEMLPAPQFRYHVHSDPEGCHICHEGQHVCMDVFFDGPRHPASSEQIDWERYRREHEGPFEERVLFAPDCPMEALPFEQRDLVLIMLHPWLPDPPEDQV